MSSTPTAQALIAASDPVGDDSDLAVAGFLARYKPATREAHGTDLRAWFAWCTDKSLGVLEAECAHVEVWTREMEEFNELAPNTIARRISTLSRLYRFGMIDGYIDRYLRVSPSSTRSRDERGRGGSPSRE